MSEKFKKSRYVLGKGCTISHTVGMSAETSTLSYYHYNKDCVFYYFIEGGGNIKVEGKNYPVAKGDLILINPSELFVCKIEGKVPHERLVLRVNYGVLDNFLQDGTSLLAPLYNRKKGVGNYIPRNTVEKAGIDNYLRDIYTYAKAQKPSSNILAICKAVELANLCATQFTSSDIKSENHSGNPLINKILVYLNEHFRENMTIEDISASFYVEKSYLSHLFKNHVGISLWKYVIYKRLNYFNDMICKGASIEEACACAGFQNYSNFFRLYKKYTNTTPSEFKARINKG
jgi:AraC-like DNA-binding protein